MNSALVVSTLLTAVSYMIVILTGLLTSSLTVADVVTLAPVLIAMSLLTGYVSIVFSSYNPIRFYSRPRENLVSNPVTLMIYLFVLLMVFAGISNAILLMEGSSLVWGIVGVVALGMMIHYPLLVDRMSKSSKLLLVLK